MCQLLNHPMPNHQICKVHFIISYGNWDHKTITFFNFSQFKNHPKSF